MTPRARATVVAAMLPAALVAGSLDAGPRDRVELEALLAAAAAHVARLLDELPRLVATEAMSQEVVESPARDAEGGARRWIAEIGWVPLTDDHEAIAVRDVIEVDGHRVIESRTRLIDLLHGSRRGTWSEARALLDQGARHNLVPGSRNFNLPTVALFFLHPDRRARFSWKARYPRDARLSSPGPFEVEFRERSRPTIIRGAAGEQIYGRGRVWLTGGGTVVRTDLRLKIGPVKYTLDTEFRHDAAVGLVVPFQMTERYDAPRGVVISTARYSNYRRFQSGARLLQ